MRPLVHVQSARPDEAAKAAHASCAWIFDAWARRRGATVLVDAWASLPGATVTPWALRGLWAAMPDAAARRSFLAVGDLDVGQRVFDAAGVVAHASASDQSLAAAPRLRLQLPGSGRDAAVPRAWVGSNLVIATPVSHRRASTRAAAPGKHAFRRAVRAPSQAYWGPASASLAALARHCRLEGSPAQLVRLGTTLAREVFASATLFVDATWWTALESDGVPMAGAVAVEHCLASPSLAQPEAAAVLDAWIGQLLGHPPTTTERPAGRLTPRIAGDRRPWPRAPLPKSSSKARSLAGRAVEAMWTKSNARRQPTARHALAPPTPGRFAQVWAQQMR